MQSSWIHDLAKFLDFSKKKYQKTTKNDLKVPNQNNKPGLKSLKNVKQQQRKLTKQENSKFG